MNFNNIIQKITSGSEFIVIGLLIIGIFMMILPMPYFLIDILIATNISISAVFLFLAFYIRSSAAFSSFPTLLLISTLFRLSLSVSTSRLALLHAFAGDIVQTFGEFVVSGNLIVGLIIFLIIAIVQFIVITKGAERVAEVSARFSLDAMPGKQMSIDGDIRAGTLNAEQASAKRASLERESQFYGAMDGAMKFVKGDAIAGLLIVAVNLIGGLLIGILQRGMTTEQAAHVYSILSIGDGLVSQIPGLMIALTSGIIVTRVSNPESGSKNLGQEITMQISSQPVPFVVAAFISIIMSIVPGMPIYVFLTLASFFIAVAFFGFRRQKQLREKESEESIGPDGKKTKIKTIGGIPPLIPILIEISSRLKGIASLNNLQKSIDDARALVAQDLGVPFPGVQIHYLDTVPDNMYMIKINEMPIVSGKLKPGFVIAREPNENLSMLNIPWEDDVRFLPDSETKWIKKIDADSIKEAGFSILKSETIVVRHLIYVLNKHSSEFMGIQETNALIRSVEESYPELVKETQRVLSIPKITEILQRLVSESISIRDIRAVLEAIIEWGQREKDTVLLTEYVRIALKRYISYRYATPDKSIPAYMLAPNVEEMVRDSIRQTSTGSYLALDPDTTKQLTQNILKTTGDVSLMAIRPVLLTAMDVRRYVRKMIEADAYYLFVLSFQELIPEIQIQPLGRIDL